MLSRIGLEGPTVTEMVAIISAANLLGHGCLRCFRGYLCAGWALAWQGHAPRSHSGGRLSCQGATKEPGTCITGAGIIPDMPVSMCVKRIVS